MRRATKLQRLRHRLIADWRRLGVPGEEVLIWMTVASIHFERAEFDTAITTATLNVVVTKIFQTTAGRMIFAKPENGKN